MRLTKKEQKDIAKKRITYLFQQAEAIFDKDKKLADRYVEIALALRNKYKVKLKQEIKRKFCKECHCFLKQGKNCIVRTKNKTLIYHCKECGHPNKLVMR